MDIPPPVAVRGWERLYGVWLLLPPSEGKRPGGDGPPLTDPSSLVAPELAATRLRVRDAVVRLCRSRPTVAERALLLPPRAAADAVAANAALDQSPSMPALDRYAGVLYAGLDTPSLSRAQRRVAEESVLVFSGLWGVVAGGDRIPDYRVPAAADLPRLGPLTPLWRDALGDILPRLLADRLVIDLRSTDYAAMWAPRRRDTDGDTVVVRVLADRPGGAKVVSYHSKHAKGRLARALLEQRTRRARISTAGDVARVAATLGWTAHATRTRGGTRLDLVDPGG